MSIPVSANTKANAPAGLEHSNRDHDKVKVKGDNEGSNKVKDVDSPASATAKAHASLNSAIIQTSLNVAIQSGNDPLALLYKTAIEGINEALAPQFGKDAVQNAAANQDNSAEATAERIIKMSTAFYDAYRQQNKLEDNAATREQFIGVVSGGFEKGFKEAQDILGGLKVLEGAVAAGIDKTHELVLKGFAAFAAGPKPDAASLPAPDPAAP
jgi:hypothetical protein